LLGSLLHDLGKGSPGDHSVVGAKIAGEVARRMGFSERDAEQIAAMARHHLLLPDTATRRDLDDPSTVQAVIEAVGSDVELLELLHYLAIADAAATGPAAWSDWKASLVRRLVETTRAVLGGAPMPESEPAPAALIRLAARGEVRVVVDGAEVAVVAPDQPGLLSLASGLLALHSLDVQSADVRTISGMALNTFRVAPRFGQFPAEELLQSDFVRMLSGSLPVEERLKAKSAKYDTEFDPRSLRLLWLNEAATDATVLEVRTRDGIGVLHWVTAALEAAGADIRSARISSLGAYVVDAFYLTDSGGCRLSEEHQQVIGSRMLRALAR